MNGRRFLPSQTIERLASGLLGKYKTTKGSLTLPIPVESLAEHILDLHLLWDVLPEEENETVLAGLFPEERMVIFNETRQSVIEGTPGLYRTILGHEIGHWELHVDRSVAAQTHMPGIERQLQFLFRSEKRSWDESNAHLFMSHLLVPHELLSPLIRGVAAFDWPFLYWLRDRFDVTISVIRISLEKMGLLYVDPQGRIHRSRAEYEGQLRMI
ncbi:MAG: hypothetical protein HYX88_04585 [Chloroflexi bacterium]|nr:hypothetical protein [Chloroflexota bacterium]